MMQPQDVKIAPEGLPWPMWFVSSPASCTGQHPTHYNKLGHCPVFTIISAGGTSPKTDRTNGTQRSRNPGFPPLITASPSRS